MSGGLRICVLTLGASMALGLPLSASAASPISQSFTTAGEHAFVVPPGVTSVQVTLVGGYGGAGNGGIPGGIPATAGATLAVSPGQTLYAEVAGDGESATSLDNQGGYGGGSTGGTDFFLFASVPAGGGGGGASDVRTCPAGTAPSACGGHSSLESRLLVAAGGGGGGGNGLSPASTGGGNGGASDQPGSNGAHDAHGDAGGGGGLRATASAGGAGGASSVCEPSSGGDCPGAGELGNGGAGSDDAGGGGGGGGGGIFGGGGGGGAAVSNIGTPESPVLAAGGGGGGGGGASGIPATAAGVSGFSLVPTAEAAQPAATFTWIPAPPTVATGTTQAVTTTTATLSGTVNPNAWQVSSCDFSISPAPGGIASFPCAQQLGAGSTPMPVSATAVGLSPGTTYTVTLLASSLQGSGSGAATTFTTLTGVRPGPGPGHGLGPNITALRLSPTRFGPVAHKAHSKVPSHKRTATATTLAFNLSQSANVTLSFQRVSPGRLLGHKCVANAKAHGQGRRCTRELAVPGSLRVAGNTDANRIVFKGRLAGGRNLAPGSYRITLQASDAGGVTTAAQHPTFTLLA